MAFFLELPSSLRKLPDSSTPDLKLELGFKKWRRLLQRKRLFKIELCLRLNVFRLFHVGHWAKCPFIDWHEWFSCKGKEWMICCCRLALSSELQIWKFHVVVWQTASKNDCTRKRAARAARLFFLIQPIISLMCGVDVTVVFYLTPKMSF